MSVQGTTAREIGEFTQFRRYEATSSRGGRGRVFPSWRDLPAPVVPVPLSSLLVRDIASSLKSLPHARGYFADEPILTKA